MPISIAPVKRTLWASLMLLAMVGLIVPISASAEQKKCAVQWTLALCQPASFRSHGKTYAEMEEERRLARIQAEARRRATAWPTEFVKISKNMKNPNSVRIPFAQAPGISADTDELNGRRVCKGSFKTGKKSKQDKDVHIDRECCLDKDEIPNPRCYYPQLGAANSPERVTGPDGKKYIK